MSNVIPFRQAVNRKELPRYYVEFFNDVYYIVDRNHPEYQPPDKQLFHSTDRDSANRFTRELNGYRITI